MIYDCKSISNAVLKILKTLISMFDFQQTFRKYPLTFATKVLNIDTDT